MKGSERNENTTPVLTDGGPKASEREASIRHETETGQQKLGSGKRLEKDCAGLEEVVGPGWMEGASRDRGGGNMER